MGAAPKNSKVRITFGNPTAVTIRDNREIETHGKSAFRAAIVDDYADMGPAHGVIAKLESYNILTRNCQNFVNDLITRVQDTRPHLQKLIPNKPRRRLVNAPECTGRSTGFIPQAKPPSATARVPSANDPRVESSRMV